MARSRALHDFEMTLLSRVVERRLAHRIRLVHFGTGPNKTPHAMATGTPRLPDDAHVHRPWREQASAQW